MIMLLALSSEGAVTRVKRQSSIRVFLTEDQQPFPCDSPVAKTYSARGIPKVDLNDEQKASLFLTLGGKFSSAFARIGPIEKEKIVQDIGRIDMGLNELYNTGKETAEERSDAAPPPEGAPPPEDSHSEPSCTVQGTAVYGNNNFTKMCTSCPWARILDENKWPDEVVGVQCDDGALNCLFDKNGEAHGMCQSVYGYAEVLEKLPDTCEILILDTGEEVLTQMWRIAIEEISVGCECAAHRYSGYS